jgi:hypothetical protein
MVCRYVSVVSWCLQWCCIHVCNSVCVGRRLTEVTILNKYNTLNNYYNVINLTSLANDLAKLKIHKNHKLIMFDTKDL